MHNARLNALSNTLVTPTVSVVGGMRGAVFFPDKIANKIVLRQTQSWGQCLDKFTARAVRHLQDLSQAADDLLKTNFDATSEHRHIRQQLKEVLPKFEAALKNLESEFPGQEDAEYADSEDRKFEQEEREAAQAVGFGYKVEPDFKQEELEQEWSAQETYEQGPDHTLY